MEFSLGNPWIFSVITGVVWALVWVGIEVLLFGDDVAGAVIAGAAGGLTFALFSIVLRRQIEQ